MAIYKNYKIDKVRKVGNILGREGLSKAAQKAVDDYIANPSYKSVMKLCGELLVIADAATYDEYLKEKVQDGVCKQVGLMCEVISNEKNNIR